MAIVDMNSESLVDDGPSTEQILKSREDRKRTGRFVAVGTALFLLALGIYQVLLNGTPQYAAIFAPGAIMFTYVLWILCVSRNQNARLERAREMALLGQELESVQCDNQTEKIENEKNSNVNTTNLEELVKFASKSNNKTYNRSYSIA